MRNISVCRITSDIKLINALDTKISLQLLFEYIQKVECALQFSSKEFLRTVASFFSRRGLTSRVNFCSQFCNNIQEIMTKKGVGENQKFKTFNRLKIRFKANKTIQGNVFVIDLFKTFFCLKTCERFEHPPHRLNPPCCYGLISIYLYYHCTLICK